MRRHPDKDWQRPNWYDLLQNIVRTEPVIVKGALKFGLKIFAKAMHSHGMIETNWDSDSSVSDGMAAMVAAWRGDEEAAEKKCSLIELPVMQEVGRMPIFPVKPAPAKEENSPYVSTSSSARPCSRREA